MRMRPDPGEILLLRVCDALGGPSLQQVGNGALVAVEMTDGAGRLYR